MAVQGCPDRHSCENDASPVPVLPPLGRFFYVCHPSGSV
ncbi:hypothetical protein ATPR_2577 [Acetobacter tropicalis NBRC 101654]|uniref:Uncharacterized protein n=1 Tax=Acetobacter tropicalis NBRC 101654 TaxID=749388 RepID=F7VGS8_9PROT|nr:hypothetical protein ATPR_2577 [Acetobacter tropicalis NBRC 101654]